MLAQSRYLASRCAGGIAKQSTNDDRATVLYHHVGRYFGGCLEWQIRAGQSAAGIFRMDFHADITVVTNVRTNASVVARV